MKKNFQIIILSILVLFVIQIAVYVLPPLPLPLYENQSVEIPIPVFSNTATVTERLGGIFTTPVLLALIFLIMISFFAWRSS